MIWSIFEMEAINENKIFIVMVGDKLVNKTIFKAIRPGIEAGIVYFSITPIEHPQVLISFHIESVVLKLREHTFRTLIL